MSNASLVLEAKINQLKRLRRLMQERIIKAHDEKFGAEKPLKADAGPSKSPPKKPPAFDLPDMDEEEDNDWKATRKAFMAGKDKGEVPSEKTKVVFLASSNGKTTPKAAAASAPPPKKGAGK